MLFVSYSATVRRRAGRIWISIFGRVVLWIRAGPPQLAQDAVEGRRYTLRPVELRLLARRFPEARQRPSLRTVREEAPQREPDRYRVDAAEPGFAFRAEENFNCQIDNDSSVRTHAGIGTKCEQTSSARCDRRDRGGYSIRHGGAQAQFSARERAAIYSQYPRGTRRSYVCNRPDPDAQVGNPCPRRSRSFSAILPISPSPKGDFGKADAPNACRLHRQGAFPRFYPADTR